MAETKVTVVFDRSFREIVTESLNYLESYHYIELSKDTIEDINEGLSISREWNYGKDAPRIMEREVKSIPEYYKFMIDVVKQQDEDIHNDYFHGEEASIVMDSILSTVSRFEEGTGNDKSSSST